MKIIEEKNITFLSFGTLKSQFGAAPITDP